MIHTVWVILSVIENDLRREMNKCSDMGSMSRYLVLSRQQMLLEVQLAFYRVRLRLINCRQFQTASMIQFSYNTAFKCLKNLTQKSATKIWNYLDLSLKTCLGWFSYSILHSDWRKLGQYDWSMKTISINKQDGILVCQFGINFSLSFSWRNTYWMRGNYWWVLLIIIKLILEACSLIGYQAVCRILIGWDRFCCNLNSQSHLKFQRYHIFELCHFSSRRKFRLINFSIKHIFRGVISNWKWIFLGCFRSDSKESPESNVEIRYN